MPNLTETMNGLSEAQSIYDRRIPEDTRRTDAEIEADAAERVKEANRNESMKQFTEHSKERYEAQVKRILEARKNAKAEPSSEGDQKTA